MGHIGNKRRHGVTDQQIVDAYSSTLSVYKVARMLGTSVTTCYRVLERNGVQRTGIEHYRKTAARYDREVSAEIRKEYEGGSSFADLIGKYGGTFYSVKEAIKRVGGTLTPVCKRLTPAEEEAVIDLNASGLSQMKISLKLHRSQSFISRVLHRHGVIYEPRARRRHPGWNGGRHLVDGGYVKLLLEPDDPMYAMVGHDGYALEHRVVMARSLGRLLLSSETVHHINGKPHDNRIENLEIRIGKHGKGQSMCCLDCGSRNIGHVALGTNGVHP